MSRGNDQIQFERILELQKEYSDIYYSDPKKLELIRQKLIEEKEELINECVNDPILNHPFVLPEEKVNILKEYDDLIFSIQEKIDIIDNILN